MHVLRSSADARAQMASAGRVALKAQYSLRNLQRIVQALARIHRAARTHDSVQVLVPYSTHYYYSYYY